MRTAYCTFTDGGKEYAYLCDDIKARVGDIAVVSSPTGLTRVTIRRINRFVHPSATKKIIGVETQDDFARKSEIVKELDSLLHSHAILAKYETLARINPTARKLLKELKELCK
jgi:hypothetical protein